MVTASFGAAIMEPQADATTATAAALLVRAYAALYRSKNAGRNRVTAARTWGYGVVKGRSRLRVSKP